jgi:hypothetical protein
MKNEECSKFERNSNGAKLLATRMSFQSHNSDMPMKFLDALNFEALRSQAAEWSIPAHDIYDEAGLRDVMRFYVEWSRLAPNFIDSIQRRDPTLDVNSPNLIFVKLYVRVHNEDHDGYCSGTDSDPRYYEDTTRIYCVMMDKRLVEMDEITGVLSHDQPLFLAIKQRWGCSSGGSGYCDCKSYCHVQSARRVKNREEVLSVREKRRRRRVYQ